MASKPYTYPLGAISDTSSKDTEDPFAYLTSKFYPGQGEEKSNSLIQEQ